MNTFAAIYQYPLKRKGGEQQLTALLPSGIKTAVELSAIPDKCYLAEMTRPTFKAGVVWEIIGYKWAGLETAFWDL